jgi:hypothetical protein
VKPLLSINIQYGTEIYSNELYEEITFEGIRFNVLDGAGIVISKLNSAHNKKRLRDIFDIYLSLQEKGSREKLLQLGTCNHIVQNNIDEFNEKVTSNWDFYKSSLVLYGVVSPDIKQILI